ncbi:tellurite resistance TerB family protein [Psychroflexus montanilacus]|uniref:TerB family tellurite resistance protein n=1 Tax=Psychroflexus montanilacus TaxID=2873598 RepID=UPI001CCE925A|nr:TerB family tellurite resistance protein [Psychroflexus montanilacus]MBZ9652499.1 TerB family tellurite resistance protein [Psychroflexus montanilacus]
MSAEDFYENIRASTKLNHFANLVNLAAIDGDIKPIEEKLLKRFSKKFDVSKQDYERILENPASFPVYAINSKTQRLEFLFDLLRIIYVDNEMDETEEFLILKYAVGLGFSEDHALEIIEKSKKLFENNFSFDLYHHFIESEDF